MAKICFDDVILSLIPTIFRFLIHVSVGGPLVEIISCKSKYPNLITCFLRERSIFVTSFLLN